MTRVHSLEIEHMLPPIAASNNIIRREDVSYFYHAKWSEQSVAVFEGSGRDSFVTFAFMVPRSDTFIVDLFATYGRKMGNYSYAIDGVERGSFVGYRRYDYYDPRPSDTLKCGVMYLEAGVHQLTFRSLGKEDSAEHGWIAADRLLLRPLHPLPLLPGTWVTSSVPRLHERPEQLRIFPNPATDGIHVSVSGLGSSLLPMPVTFEIFDLRGDSWLRQSHWWRGGHEVGPVLDVSRLPSGSYTVVATVVGAPAVRLSSTLSIRR
jgi:hypothetical protein